uniref:Uncharacterized protein LOC109506256 n=1 Tax=Elaeis guineensis var. tenera TaxID=51953 RepID=A0A6J0PML1_ELAGV|nr:uncharacterized protein LOC109506256 [Elaeis guineensis]
MVPLMKVSATEKEHKFLMNFKTSKEKVLEQEPEILSCCTTASPLSPKLFIACTPLLLGVMFISMYTSLLDQARTTAVFICTEYTIT